MSEGGASASGSLIRHAESMRKDGGVVTAGAEVSCQPHLRDSFGNASAAPDEALAARLVAPDGEHTIALKRLNNAVGAHSLSYTPYVAGAYELHITLHGEAIVGSPVDFRVTPGPPNGPKSKLHPPSEACVADVPTSMLLQLFDRFGNQLDRGGAAVGARALGPGASAVAVDDLQDGTYVLRFSQAAAGECKIMARIDNVDIAPVSITVNAAAAQQQQPQQQQPQQPPQQ